MMAFLTKCEIHLEVDNNTLGVIFGPFTFDAHYHSLLDISLHVSLH